MHALLLAWLLLPLPCSTVQEPAAAAAPRVAEADPLATELRELEEEAAEAQREFGRSYSEAPEAERGAFYVNNHPARRFWQRYQALAERAGSSEVAAEAWIEMLSLYARALQLDPKTEAGAGDRALALLLERFATSAKLERLPSVVANAGNALQRSKPEDALRALLAKSPHRAVQGHAAFHLAETLLGRSPVQRDPARRDEAIALYERVARDYADLELWVGKTLGAAAEGALFEQRYLQVGMPAPDFEAHDQDGVAFRLSDYRGKVVVLDFWGFW
jgi:hypothetical protein